MSVEDFRINASVRQVLASNWVDLNAVRYGAAGRIVFFHGKFQKLRNPGSGEWESAVRPETMAEDLALLQNVEKVVRGDPNVLDVVFRLDNFRKVRGRWQASGG